MRFIAIAALAISIVCGNSEAANPKFNFGRLACADNTSRWLRLNGYPHLKTWASSDYLNRWIRISKSSARAGDVRYNPRFKKRKGRMVKIGGHTQPVVANKKGVVYCNNPSTGRGWRIRVCPAGGVYLRSPKRR